jgi:hypothetical protein
MIRVDHENFPGSCYVKDFSRAMLPAGKGLKKVELECQGLLPGKLHLTDSAITLISFP